MEIGPDAQHDVRGEGEIEHHDVAGREARVAHDRLVPGGVALREEARRPVERKHIRREPDELVEDAAHFLARGHLGGVAIAGVPDVGPHRDGHDGPDHDRGVEHAHPVELEVRVERVEPGLPGEGALIDAHRAHHECEGRESEKDVAEGELGSGRGDRDLCHCHRVASVPSRPRPPRRGPRGRVPVFTDFTPASGREPAQRPPDFCASAASCGRCRG